MRLGALAGVLASVGYAGTVIFGTKLADAGLQSTTALSIRFGLSGAVLLVLARVRGLRLMPVRGERAGIFLLGAIGYMAESSFFFAAISRGSAAAVTLLFYVYPAIVTVIEAVRERRRPPTTTLVALALSVSGCVLVAGAGAEVNIERLGIVFAMCSAVTFALYVTVGARLSNHTDPMVTGAWVAIGASVSFTVRALVGAGYAATDGQWHLLLPNGLANALAFGMMFFAIGRLGAARAAVILTLEAVFTVILAVLFLDEALAGWQLLGAVAVLAAAVTVAASKPSSDDVVEAEAAVP